MESGTLNSYTTHHAHVPENIRKISKELEIPVKVLKSIGRKQLSQLNESQIKYYLLGNGLSLHGTTCFVPFRLTSSTKTNHRPNPVKHKFFKNYVNLPSAFSFHSVGLNEDFGTMGSLFLFSLLMTVFPSHSKFNPLNAIKVRSAISLPGRVLTSEDALKLLQRRAEVTFQVNLPRYLVEFRQTNTRLKLDFSDKNFAVLGFLAALDAAITFAEGVENVNVIRRDKAAGFPGKPNPTNDKLHTGVQRLNAVRNIVWLLKEKLKSGIVSSNASLIDKLKEVQTWLSTQTGGHLGQGVTFALKKSGLMQRLEVRWGDSSLKFRSFSASVGNGLDFLINGYNTVVNSLALNQEINDANILGLTSSLTAMAGDVAMGVTQVLSTSTKASKAAGAVGYAVAATLYVVSYAVGVSQGIITLENLEAKDYVKIFLSPLIPDPTFGTTVDMIDQYAKGNVLEGDYLFLSKSLPAAFYMVGMAASDMLTGSSDFMKYLKFLKGMNNVLFLTNIVKFEEAFAANVNATVRELRPKQILFAFPHLDQRDRYFTGGWSGDDVKKTFHISTELSPVHLFMATYSNEFARPFDCPDKANQGFTFCPEAAPHGEDKLIFMGTSNVNEKVMLDDNCEAYGMGGDDYFVLKAAVVRKGVKVNGGNGSDTIDLRNTLYGSRSSVIGGGPERDIIKTGPGDDTIVVDNDDVEVTNGDNTLLVEGKGSDDIRLGTGADLVFVEKTGGSISLGCAPSSNEDPSRNKPKRIVYKGEGRIKNSRNNDFIRGGPGQFDLLTMRKYSPNLQPQVIKNERILLIEKGTAIDEYLQKISQVRDVFFNGHKIEVKPNGHMRSKAQRIQFSFIERFEMSEHTINMLLLMNGKSDYYEVTGGPKHDFVINLDGSTPLLAQLGTGDNRVLSGDGQDSFSVVLDVGNDVIYDKGGENILGVLLPQGTTLNDATIGRSKKGEGYKIKHKARPKNHQIVFIFLGAGGNRDTVKIIIEDSSGKQITFKPVPPPSQAHDSFAKERSIGGYYYDKFEFCPGDQDVLLVEGIAPPIGENLRQPQC